MILNNLPDHWRERAGLLRSHGAEGQALTCEALAADLEGALREQEMEPLALDEASAESGYSVSQLRRMRADGKVTATDDGRILRRHLPRKPGHGVARTHLRDASSRTQVARAAVTGD